MKLTASDLAQISGIKKNPIIKKPKPQNRRHGKDDPLYEKAKAFVIHTKMTKVLDIVDRFEISTIRATELLRAMEDDGIVSRVHRGRKINVKS